MKGKADLTKDCRIKKLQKLKTNKKKSNKGEHFIPISIFINVFHAVL